VERPRPKCVSVAADGRRGSSGPDRTLAKMTALREPQRTPETVKAALRASEKLLMSMVERAADRLPDGSATLDELERAIEDVTDPLLYRQLRHLLGQLDQQREEIRWRARNVEIHSGLDPVRIALRELEAGFR
jgi:hypothetical protein